MANPTWPTTVPQFVLESGYQEKYQDQVMESTMDAGPAKLRRRFTKSLRTFQVTLQMTATQAAAFETFWGTTCKGGSLAFDWVHPRTQAAATYRFRNPAPQFSSVGGVAVRVSFTLEII
jgi:phage-related protein